MLDRAPALELRRGVNTYPGQHLKSRGAPAQHEGLPLSAYNECEHESRNRCYDVSGPR